MSVPDENANLYNSANSNPVESSLLRDYPFLSPPNEDELAPRLGPYRILKVLGRGGMGVVFLGEHLISLRQEAVKVMRPDVAAESASRKRFLREARAAASLDHPNIVTIHNVGEVNNVPYLTMPFLNGESLADRLQREGKLSIEEAARIGGQIAEGLANAHDNGLIHRDIKPENIWLVQQSDQVKILDFGLAKSMNGNSTLTRVGGILGTPDYMAPEQANGERIKDPRCDLFSLGSLLYHMTTGSRPFRMSEDATQLAIVLAVATKSPIPPQERNPDIPASLSDLIEKLMEKEPGNRPANAQEVADQLRRIENGTSGTTTPGPIPVATPAPPRRPERPSAPEAGDIFTGPLGMKFAHVPKGTFWMSENDANAKRQVTIEQDFQMGIYQVTQGEWEAIMDNNPSWFLRNGKGKEKVRNISEEDLKRFPVECVSWEDVQEFLKRLNEQKKDGGWVYRLPTEAEWEYTCRGGAQSKQQCSFDFYFAQPSNDLSSTQANFDGNHPAGNAAKGPDLGRTTKVGSYEPNALGVYDMHGNVWEWCQDWYTEGSYRVIRGGGWYYRGWDCRAEYRSRRMPPYWGNYLGFRLARSSVEKQE